MEMPFDVYVIPLKRYIFLKVQKNELVHGSM